MRRERREGEMESGEQDGGGERRRVEGASVVAREGIGEEQEGVRG